MVRAGTVAVFILVAMIAIAAAASSLTAQSSSAASAPKLRRKIGLSTACQKIAVPSNTRVVDTFTDGTLLLVFPNGTERTVPPCRDIFSTDNVEQLTRQQQQQQQQQPMPVSKRQQKTAKPTTTQRHRTAAARRNSPHTKGQQARHHNATASAANVSDPPNQWLAWYFTETAVWESGATSFSSNWAVPGLPAVQPSNLAIFPGLQPTYDPKPYDFILQPVLSIGSWMDGDTDYWGLNSVMCHNGGTCIYSKMFKTQPGNEVLGTMTLVSTHPNNRWNVTTLDTTTGLSNSILYDTTTSAIWAFVALEHNPAGPIGNCETLPRDYLTFTQNNLVPPSSSMWQGAIGDGGCDISVDTFPADAVKEMSIQY